MAGRPGFVKHLPRGFFYASAYGVLVLFFAPNWFGLISMALMWVNLGSSSPKKEKVRGCVFVSGADSGLGKTTALHLAQTGYHVFAGCLQKESKETLESAAKKYQVSIENIEFVNLDVTKTDSIQAAAQRVRSRLGALGYAPPASHRGGKGRGKAAAAGGGREGPGAGLVGLVHCAGLGVVAPAHAAPEGVFEAVMAVNFYGAVKLTQALYPLLDEACSDGTISSRVLFTGNEPPEYPVSGLEGAAAAASGALAGYAGALRAEGRLKLKRLEAAVLYPGFVPQTGYARSCLALSTAAVKGELGAGGAREEADQELMERYFVNKTLPQRRETTPIQFARLVERVLRRGTVIDPAYQVNPPWYSTLYKLLPVSMKEYSSRAENFRALSSASSRESRTEDSAQREDS